MSDEWENAILFGEVWSFMRACDEWEKKHPGKPLVIRFEPIKFPIHYTREQVRTGPVTESDVGRPDD